MYFLTNWIFIVFEFGGLATLIIALLKLRKLNGTHITVDPKIFGSGIKLLIAFVVLATLSITGMFIRQFGESGMLIQIITNLATGVVFILSIMKLTKSIQASD